MRDRSHPLELLRQAAARRDQAGVRRRLAPRGADHDGLVDLASNDYLGLGGDAIVVSDAVFSVDGAQAPVAAIAVEEGLRVSTPDAAVLAVTVGESAVAVRSQKACAAYGVRVGCFRPPAVPLRLIVPGTRRSRVRRATRRSC